MGGVVVVWGEGVVCRMVGGVVRGVRGGLT